MTSIFFIIVRIYVNQFKCNYLRKKKSFLNPLLHFWNLHQILNIFKKKIWWLSYLTHFRIYGLLKTRLDKCLKSPVSEHRSTVNMLKGHKHHWNVRGSTFIYFFITLSKIKLENVSLSEIWNLRTVCYHIHWRSQAFFL